MKRIGRLLRGAARRCGYDIVHYSPSSKPLVRLCRALDHFGVDAVVDVGANSGQFATTLREAGFRGLILSYEPLAEPHRRLEQNAARDPLWIVHPRCAVGRSAGEAVINVSANSVSSSLLPMLDTHAKADSRSAYVGTERVPTVSLDDTALAQLGSVQRPFIKIDTQGFEPTVLDGAQTLLERSVGVLCELSLVPLYEGQQLWEDLIERMRSTGFTLWSIEDGFTDSQTGRTLQVDAAFFRVSARA